ncbi:hypothetical protein CAPTEDRAFT_198881, partial [Capitella teleta]
ARSSSKICFVPHTGCLLPPGGQLLHKLSPHWQEVNDIDVLPNGALVASASDDNTVKVSNVSTGELLLTVTLPWDVLSVRFFSGGRHLAATTLLNNLYIIDYEAGIVTKEIKMGLGSNTKPIVACRTGDKAGVIGVLLPNKVQVIDAFTGKQLFCIPDQLDSKMSKTYNEKKHLVTREQYVVYAGYLKNCIQVLPLEKASDSTIKTIEVFPEQIDESTQASRSHITALTIAQSQGVTMAVVCDGLTEAFMCFNLDDHQLLISTAGKPNEFVAQCSFSPLNGHVYYATHVRIINMADNQRSLHFQHPCRVQKVIGLDGTHVVTLGDDSVLRIWDQTIQPFSPDVSAFTGKVTDKSESNLAMFKEKNVWQFGNV